MLTLLCAVEAHLAQLRKRMHGASGATAVEYSLMVAFIAIVIVGAVTLIGREVAVPFSQVATAIP